MKDKIREICYDLEIGCIDWTEASEQLFALCVVGSSLCIDDEIADVLVEKIYKKNKKDLKYLTDKEGIFKAGLAHGLLSKTRLHE